MAKKPKELHGNDNPVSRFGAESIAHTAKASLFLAELTARILKDDGQRSVWDNKQRYFQRRRMGYEFRNPTFPWVDSSDIVMPLIDMMIDKLRPAFLNVVFAQQKTVSFKPLTAPSIERARTAEAFFNWFVSYQCEDLYEEVDLGIDRMLQAGHIVFKVTWEHRTRSNTLMVVRSQMPERWKRLVVLDVTEEEAQRVTQLTKGERVVMTPDEFESKRTQITAALAIDFDLDESDPVEAQSLSDIFAFIKDRDMGNTTSVKRRTVEYSWPKLVSCSSYDIIVPEGSTRIQQADYVSHRFFVSEERMRRNVLDLKWDKGVVEQVLSAKGNLKGSVGATMRQFNTEGEYGEALDINDSSYELLETYCWEDVDGSGIPKKMVIIHSPYLTERPLYKSELPYVNGKWPFVKIDFERIGDSFYSSRGVPVKLDDLDVEITFQHRQKLNRMQIANAPTFKYRLGSDLNPNNIRFTPGEFMPVMKMDDIQPLVIPNVDISFDREEQILRTWAEQHIGGTDFGLTSSGSMTEARTAKEIRAIEGNRQIVLSSRVRAFQLGMRQVWNMMWDMIMQFRSSDIFITVTGQKPVQLSIADIQGDFDIVPEGAVGFDDPQYKTQKALARLQVLMQISEQVRNDPAMFAKYDVDIGEAVLSYLEEDDITQASAIMRRRSPEETQQIQQQQQEQQAKEQAIMQNVPTDPAELAEFVNRASSKLPHGRSQRIAGAQSQS